MKVYNIKLSICCFLISFFTYGQTRPKVGLVLSGGGAKGYAHIGVLKVLEESDIRIDYISGTSMGAVIGGLYASGYSANEIDSILHKTDFNKIIFNEKVRKNIPLFDKTYKEKYILEIPISNFSIQIPSAISKGQGSLDYLSSLLSSVHSINNFSQLPIPFVCVATILNTGKEKIFENGYLPEAIMASSALPGLIEPFYIDGVAYIDGGLVNNLPAKVLKDKNIDIIIGVDLSQGLKLQDEIKDLPELINQINNFTIFKGIEEQKPYCDFIISPKLKGINLTDFSKKDSVIIKGKLAAEKYLENFKKIAKQQGRENYTVKKVIVGKNISISKIKINGEKKYNSSYIKGKLGLKPPITVEYQDILNGISNLYSSGVYKNITHKLVDNNDGTHLLELNVLENKNHFFVKFGLHYDDTFKTGLLINLTDKRFIFNNTQLSFDIILGDNPRYELNIFSDNGIVPSLGFNSRYIRVPLNSNEFTSNLDKILHKTKWFNQQIYVQSTLYDKYALGLGIEHDYIQYSTKKPKITNLFLTLENSFFLSTYSYLRIDSRDNPNYPKKGIKFDAKANYLLISNQDNFNPSLLLNGTLNYFQTLYNKITLQSKVSFGTSFDNSSFIHNNFIGGDYNQEFINFEKFYGIRIGEKYNKHKVLFYSGLQLQVFKNNYITLFGNIANLENEISDLQYFKYKYTGIGIMYGYDSPLGPLNFRYSYSPSEKNSIFSVALGYWF